MRRMTITVFLLLAGLVSLGAITSGAGAATAVDLHVTVSDAPDPVSAGGKVGYTSTVTNTGADATGVVVTDKPPKGTHFDSATPEGACTVGRYDVVSCAVGDLPSGGSASVTVVFALGPSVVGGTVLRDKVFAFSHEGDISDADNLVIEKTTVAPAEEDGVDTYVPASGGTVTTGSTATPGNPTSTTAEIPETPEGVPAGIDERDAAFVSDGCGYRTNCFGQVIDIDVPFLFSQADPMVFTFTFDASSVPPGIKLGKVSMVHDGVLLKRCTGPGATPEPSCVSNVALLAGGDLQITARTETNGSWRGH